MDLSTRGWCYAGCALDVGMARHHEYGRAADLLNAHPAIWAVQHRGLSLSDYDLAQRQLNGFSGLLSVGPEA